MGEKIFEGIEYGDIGSEIRMDKIGNWSDGGYVSINPIMTELLNHTISKISTKKIYSVCVACELNYDEITIYRISHLLGRDIEWLVVPQMCIGEERKKQTMNEIEEELDCLVELGFLIEKGKTERDERLAKMRKSRIPRVDRVYKLATIDEVSKKIRENSERSEMIIKDDNQ